MMKLRRVQGGGFVFWCPGCNSEHSVNTNPSVRWAFNGDMNNPTFHPSIKVTKYRPNGEKICHSFVTDGNIQFLNDCHHALVNQTVPIPDWPFKPGEYGGIEE